MKFIEEVWKAQAMKCGAAFVAKAMQPPKLTRYTIVQVEELIRAAYLMGAESALKMANELDNPTSNS